MALGQFAVRQPLLPISILTLVPGIASDMGNSVRDLAQTIQALYDSEINVTITMLWDGGIEFALC